MSINLGTVYSGMAFDISGWSKNVKKAAEDMDHLEKKGDRLESKFQTIGNKLTSSGKSLSTKLTLPIIGVGAAMTKFAMDSTETENLFKESMGSMTKEAEAWTESLSNSLGLNEYELKQNVGMFNAMFDSMKMGTQASYNMSTGLTELAYDMASFYNLNPDEAFEKLRAGITGETEPLKSLGILINETTVKSHAYKNGIAEVGQELTEQQKVQARYKLIMEQTTKAQGDLARTIDSPTNKLRVLSSRTKEVAADYGQLLIPIVNKGIDVLGGLVKWLDSLDDRNKKIILTIAGVVASIGPVLLIVGSITKGIGVLIPLYNALKVSTIAQTYAQGGLNAVMAANPIAMVILAIGALVAAGVALYRNWDTVVYNLKSAWLSMQSFGLKVFHSLKLGALLFVKKYLEAYEVLLSWIPGIKEKIGEAKDAIDGMIESSKQKAQTAIIEMENKKRAHSYEKTAIEIQKSIEDIGSISSKGHKEMIEDIKREKLERKGLAKTVEDTSNYAANATSNATGRMKSESKSLMDTISDHLSKISERVENSISIVEKKLELWSLKNNIAKESSEYLTQQIEMQKEKQLLLNEEIQATENALAKVIAKYGQSSSQAIKLQNDLLGLRIEQEQLKDSIEKTTNELEKQIDSYSRLEKYLKKRAVDSSSRDIVSYYKAQYYNKLYEEGKIYHDGGLVKKYHDGGPIEKISSFFGKLRSDEVPAILQTGEYVLSRDMIKNIKDSQGIDYDKLGKVLAKYIKPSITMQNTFNSPEALSRVDMRREQEILYRNMALEWGG